MHSTTSAYFLSAVAHLNLVSNRRILPLKVEFSYTRIIKQYSIYNKLHYFSDIVLLSYKYISTTFMGFLNKEIWVYSMTPQQHTLSVVYSLFNSAFSHIYLWLNIMLFIYKKRKDYFVLIFHTTSLGHTLSEINFFSVKCISLYFPLS